MNPSNVNPFLSAGTAKESPRGARWPLIPPPQAVRIAASAANGVGKYQGFLLPSFLEMCDEAIVAIDFNGKLLRETAAVTNEPYIFNPLDEIEAENPLCDLADPLVLRNPVEHESHRNESAIACIAAKPAVTAPNAEKVLFCLTKHDVFSKLTRLAVLRAIFCAMVFSIATWLAGAMPLRWSRSAGCTSER